VGAWFGAWLLLGALLIPVTARADALEDMQLMRAGGCAGSMPARSPLRHAQRLDRAAALWASGASLAGAAERAGYAGGHLEGLHITGGDDAILQNLRRNGCVRLMGRDLTDAGIYRRGGTAWLVLASVYTVPANMRAAGRGAGTTRLTPDASTLATSSPAFAERVLALVNQARARGTRCGTHAFAPTTPVHLSATLDDIASGHALDMAQHDYFEHQDLSGRTPADRVRAAGYREQLVGENIAFGPRSPEEVVRGWLHSPGHCENIMDTRFATMGIAYSYGPAPQGAWSPGLYWVQDFVDPK
jgi:uncharacterized protein YkwD